MKISYLFRAVGLSLVLAVTACAPGSGLPPLPAVSPDSAYHLGVGDSVRIITVGGEQLSGEFRVNAAGKVAVPLVGAMQAANLTTTELEQNLVAALKAGNFIPNPSVSVEVTVYRQISILGEVKTPGRYPYQPGITLLDAVSMAGGFTYRSVQDYASIERTVDDHIVEGKATRESAIEPGDRVTIFERLF